VPKWWLQTNSTRVQVVEHTTHCAPVWLRSAYASLVDVQLNSTMHLISGTLHPTPLSQLPVPASIELQSYEKAGTDKLVWNPG